jgi:hypothetical protein
MTRRRWLACTTLLTLLTCAGCTAGAPPASDTTPSGTRSPTDSRTITGSDPPTLTASDPPTHSGGPESPQSPDEKSSITVPIVLESLRERTFFTEGAPTSCDETLPHEIFNEDLTVTKVRLSPADEFVQDDSACPAEAVLCREFVFLLGQHTACSVGVRWIPRDHSAGGAMTVRMTAVCRTRDDELCHGLTDPPPEGGTQVTAVAILRLRVRLGGLFPPTLSPDPNTVTPSLAPLAFSVPFTWRGIDAAVGTVSSRAV